MNRRQFFATLGIGSLTWPIAKQIQLPGSHVFQPKQIVKKVTIRTIYNARISETSCHHLQVFHFQLICPQCNFKGGAFFESWFTHEDELYFHCFTVLNGLTWELPCPSCKFEVKFKIAEDCKWYEESHDDL